MTFDCADLERALESDDAVLRAAARTHARTCAACRSELELDDALTAAARTLHREWDSPTLRTRIAAQMRESDRFTIRQLIRGSAWARVAAAAVLVLAAASVTWIGWRALQPAPPAPTRTATEERLLSEEALAAIERSEAQYARAIDELTRLTAPKLDMPDAPLLVNLRERLNIIDAAIAETRAEIARNRFNAHLRRQLLSIYQEKRRTLEQIQEYDPNAL